MSIQLATNLRQVSTRLVINNLSVNINDIEQLLLSIYDIREIENVKIEHGHHNSRKQDNKNSGPNDE